jgi:DNA-binding transcriptional LysR family regulator
MNKFLAVSVFTKVVECRGFTTAAKKMGISVSAVTKTLAKLEDDLQVQLINRTTRQLSTTEHGQEFYEHCVGMLADLEEAETILRNKTLVVAGRVRVVVPFSFGRVTLVPELPAFYAQYPDVSLEISFSDEAIDMIADGFDVAVRTGNISDSRLTTRLLTKGPQVTAAAPSYLARFGTPRTPQDLHRHNCIVGRFGAEWAFLGEDRQPITVRVGGNIHLNSGDALREAGVAGLGIVQGTLWLFRKDLEAGRLVQVLADHATDGAPVSVLSGICPKR